ncbi:hypothetical protein ACILG0_11715 [Pseudomonadota bacterium AL_CKDN230030165-1A_HGKHYDSX7]
MTDGPSHITPADGNIFADLGFPLDEAARLLACADRKIKGQRSDTHSMFEALPPNQPPDFVP